MGQEKNLSNQENFNDQAKGQYKEPRVSNVRSEEEEDITMTNDRAEEDDQKGKGGTEIPNLTGHEDDGGGAGRNNGSDASGR